MIRLMRFKLLIVVVVMSSMLNCHAFTFSNESLNYKVMYKWGLVNKQAGHATLSLKNNGANYDTRLVAASEKWADSFFKVRDTLTGSVRRNDFRPIIYKKMTHEGGERKHDEVRYTYSGNSVVGDCIRIKWDKKGNKTVNEKRTLAASGITMDMLSSFYFMRSRPYNEWKAGHKQTINLFSGKRKEILTLTYHGVDDIEIDNRKYRAYYITFTFTDPSKPKNQTSDPMEAWISTDSKRIPLKLEGKLKVGKVQCFYVP